MLMCVYVHVHLCWDTCKTENYKDAYFSSGIVFT